MSEKATPFEVWNEDYGQGPEYVLSTVAPPADNFGKNIFPYSSMAAEAQIPQCKLTTDTLTPGATTFLWLEHFALRTGAKSPVAS